MNLNLGIIQSAMTANTVRIGATLGARAAIIAAFLLAVVPLSACAEPDMEVNDPGLGETPMARHIAAVWTGGDDDFRARELTRWLKSKCVVEDAGSIAQCVTSLGMVCTPATRGEVTCKYSGIVRGRRFRGVDPNSAEAVWALRIAVTARYRDGEGFAVTYGRSRLD